MGRRNPLTDWAHFFGERYPWRNHACEIWWRSLKGFRGSCGSNFSISHYFAGRPYNTLTLPCERVIILSLLIDKYRRRECPMFINIRRQMSIIKYTCANQTQYRNYLQQLDIRQHVQQTLHDSLKSLLRKRKIHHTYNAAKSRSPGSFPLTTQVAHQSSTGSDTRICFHHPSHPQVMHFTAC